MHQNMQFLYENYTIFQKRKSSVLNSKTGIVVGNLGNRSWIQPFWSIRDKNRV